MDAIGSRTTTGTRVDTPAPEASHREWGWVLRVVALVAVFVAVAVFRSRQVDVPFRDPHGKLFSAKLVSTAEVLLVFVAVDIVVRWLRGRADGARLWRTARTRWTPYRIGMIALALVAYQVVYLSYRNLKSWDVFRTPQDDVLLKWDRWLFFGHSPAVLLHDLLGRDVTARFLTDWYEAFSTVVPLSLVAAVPSTPTVRSAFVFVVPAMGAWTLGVASSSLPPSPAPSPPAPAEFAGLTHTSIQT